MYSTCFYNSFQLQVGGKKTDGGKVEFDIQACSCMAGLAFQVLAIFWLVSSWRRSQREVSQCMWRQTVVFTVYYQHNENYKYLTGLENKNTHTTFLIPLETAVGLFLGLNVTSWNCYQWLEYCKITAGKTVEGSHPDVIIVVPVCFPVDLMRGKLFITLTIHSNNYRNDKFGWRQASCFFYNPGLTEPQLICPSFVPDQACWGRFSETYTNPVKSMPLCWRGS